VLDGVGHFRTVAPEEVTGMIDRYLGADVLATVTRGA
jgi:hypothetical protein